MLASIYRSGTSTLAEAARSLGLEVHREFPKLTSEQFKRILLNPKKAIDGWFEEDSGAEKVIALAGKHGLICDGLIALLPFLSPDKLNDLKNDAKKENVHLEFVVSSRDIKDLVQSELQHWVVHDLEGKAGLSLDERGDLEESLRKRASKHQEIVKDLHQKRKFVKVLPIDPKLNITETWPPILSTIQDSFSERKWLKALCEVGKQNANPRLPVEGILLTFRFGTDNNSAQTKIDRVEKLLDAIEMDSLCRYVLVIALDEDEKDNDSTNALKESLNRRGTGSKHLLSLSTFYQTPRNLKISLLPSALYGMTWRFVRGEKAQIGLSCSVMISKLTVLFTTEPSIVAFLTFHLAFRSNLGLDAPGGMTFPFLVAFQVFLVSGRPIMRYLKVSFPSIDKLSSSTRYDMQPSNLFGVPTFSHP